MSVVVSSAERQALDSRLNRLNLHVDTETVDDLLDEIFKQIGSLNNVVCTLASDSEIKLYRNDQLVASVQLARAKSILRMICARLSVRCSAWMKRAISPYGEDIEFEHPDSKKLCRVSFKNTPDMQRIEVSDSSALEA